MRGQLLPQRRQAQLYGFNRIDYSDAVHFLIITALISFGTLKYHIFGHPRMLLRGLRGAATEIGLAVMSYNLKRMVNLLGAQNLSAQLRNAWLKSSSTLHAKQQNKGALPCRSAPCQPHDRQKSGFRNSLFLERPSDFAESDTIASPNSFWIGFTLSDHANSRNTEADRCRDRSTQAGSRYPRR
jgi:hypothetical protein